VTAACDLCEAARITPWYHECEVCWIAECEVCAVPMAVWRAHGVDPPPGDRAHMLEALAEVVADHCGFEAWFDHDMRNIPDHYHVHARPRGGFYGPGFGRPLRPPA
jgi:hypothetical protein